ncbi:MAG TPA: AmmeMemoRadiSam system protein B [Thermoanaerobaculaceae bacterium]|nr:AmmeMemoRadiSam system protein B [Thermoanaerobaculaceae bacterium]HPS77579.1 AmmeMemoRadiSam system protein B [Thermoanaerobaculaceae bacterium]
MRVCPVLVALLLASGASAQAPTPATPPSSAEVRAAMGIPSTDEVRGQQDKVGFASTAAQMAAVWDKAGALLPEERLQPPPKPGVAGAVCAHDDYLYAGRVYKAVLPLVTARTVVLVGVFHKWRRFGAHDVLVFDAGRAWRTPDGEMAASAFRKDLLAAMPAGSTVVSGTFHDSEHSLEALAYWLHHARADREIVPILVSTASFERLGELSGQLGQALAATMRQRGMQLGRDVAVVISADAVHYGADFAQTPFGEGGVSAFQQATARDRALLTGPLAGPITTAKLREAYTTWVDPADPGTYRVSWCGRFSIPFGMMLLADLAGRLGLPVPQGVPVAYGTSVGGPELPLQETGLGTTAPSNLYHFVGYPGLAVVLQPAS